MYMTSSLPSPLQVTLCPGDVLFIPKHWWHYVECTEPAVSVNTWIDLVGHAIVAPSLP